MTTKYSLDQVTRNIHCSYNAIEFTNIKKEMIGISRHTSRCKIYFFFDFILKNLMKNKGLRY
jgi:hypothetical protein